MKKSINNISQLAKMNKYLGSMITAVFFLLLMTESTFAQKSASFEEEEEKSGYFSNGRVRIGASLSLLSSQPQSNSTAILAPSSKNGQFLLNTDLFILDKSLAISTGVGLMRMNLTYDMPTVRNNSHGGETIVDDNLITQSQSTHLVIPLAIKYRSPLIRSNMKLYASAGGIYTKVLQHDAFEVSKKDAVATQPRRIDVPLATSNIESEIKVGAEFLLARSLMSDISLSYRKQLKSSLTDQDLRLGTFGVNFGIFF